MYCNSSMKCSCCSLHISQHAWLACAFPVLTSRFLLMLADAGALVRADTTHCPDLLQNGSGGQNLAWQTGCPWHPTVGRSGTAVARKEMWVGLCCCRSTLSLVA
jgi:hypothetical protein